MRPEYIRGLAEKLKREAGTANPFKLCRFVGAELEYKDIGRLKGMYTCIQGTRFVVINENLGERERRIVCAHELGHDLLHRELAESRHLQEFMLYDMSSRPEYEANVFACHVLLPDEEVLSAAAGGCDAAQLAEALDTDVNLVLIKIHELNRSGLGLKTPYAPKGSFLKY